jgi:hypothetical protein
MVNVFEVLPLSGGQCVREVKELDLKSNGLCPHGFEPRRCRFLVHQALLLALMISDFACR